MSEYDFEGELRAALAKDFDCEQDGVCDYPEALAALRRAYAAGVQASGGGSDLDRLVTLAAAHPSWTINDPQAESDWDQLIAGQCAQLLSALKAQAVKP